MEQTNTAICFTETVENRDVPLADIRLEKTFRNANRRASDDKALVQSIKEIGVIEAVVLNRQDDGSLILIAGERRFRACLELGMEWIPARIILTPLTVAAKRLIQFAENQHRNGHDLLNLARMLFSFFTDGLGYTSIDAILGDLMTYRRDPTRLKETAATVAALERATKKKSRTFANILTLLKLPAEVQEAIEEKHLSPSTAYVLAERLNHPDFDKIFQDCINRKLSKSELRRTYPINGKTYETPSLENRFDFYMKSFQEILQSLNLQNAEFSREEAQELLLKINELRIAIHQSYT